MADPSYLVKYHTIGIGGTITQLTETGSGRVIHGIDLANASIPASTLSLMRQLTNLEEFNEVFWDG